MSERTAILDGQNLWATETKSAEALQELETNIETRLTNLGDRITRRAESPFHTLLGNQDASSEMSVELAVQQAALLWIARIAKYSEGDIRVRLWLDIERALSDLEKIETRIARPREKSFVLVEPVSGTAHPCLQTRH